MINFEILNGVELWLLANLLNPGIIIGLKDPTSGLVRGEIDKARNDGLQSLKKKSIITQDLGTNVKIKNEVKELIRVITNPTHTVIVGVHSINNVPSTRTYHYSHGGIVLLEEFEPGLYKVEKVEDRLNIIDYLLAEFKVKVFLNAEGISYNIPESIINDARVLLRKGKAEEARVAVRRANMSEEDINSFLPALDKPQVNMSIVVFCNRDKVQNSAVKGFAVLTHEMNLFLLEITNRTQSIARVRRISKLMLEKRVDAILPKLEAAQ